MLGIGIGLTSRAMGGVSAAWNPSRLTGLAVTLLPAESRSRGLLWQNTAKTTPATADGDPVRVAVCPFTAVEFTAPSDAARPLLWDEGGGKWSMFFDGVDDIFIGSSLASGSAWTTAGRYLVAAQSREVASLNTASTNDGWRIGWTLTPTVQLTYGGVASYGSPLTYPTSSAFTRTDLIASGGNWTRRVNGSGSATATGTINWSGTPRPSVGGHSGLFTSVTSGRVPGFTLYTGTLSIDDVLLLETYLGAL